MSAAARLALVPAAAILAAAVAAAETPNLVSPKPGEAVTAGGVRVRILPRTERAPEDCCVVQFRRWDAASGRPGAWVTSDLRAETTLTGAADAVGVSLRREAFRASTRWRVRARFTNDRDWTDWREFTVLSESR